MTGQVIELTPDRLRCLVNRWRRAMQESPPFSMRNRPWLSQDCIDAINERYMSYIAKVDPADRENLRGWAANQAEIGYCLDHPDVVARCKEWGDLRMKAK